MFFHLLHFKKVLAFGLCFLILAKEAKNISSVFSLSTLYKLTRLLLHH